LLSNSAEYALKAVLYIAAAPGHPVRAVEIAQALSLPRNYLSKILNSLSSGGILKSFRGRTGGFALARNPEEITLAEIVAKFDRLAASPPACLMGAGGCDERNKCSAHLQWTNVQREVTSFFETTTVAQLLGTAP
jgi:Rrf2 family iron-sulfur cluster assembly transcriptional regulator